MTIYPLPSGASEVHLAQFAEVIRRVSSEVHVIAWRYPFLSGQQVPAKLILHPFSVRLHYADSLKPKACSYALWFLKSLVLQAQLLTTLASIGRQVDMVFFLGLAYHHLLPILLLRLLNVKTVVAVWARPTIGMASIRSKQGIWRAMQLATFRTIEAILLKAADQIASESASATEFMGLSAYRDKVCVYGSPYVDSVRFRIVTPVDQRRDLVAYVGRLNQVKGVLAFVNAVPIILERSRDVEFLVAGEGPLREEIEQRVRTLQLSDRVLVREWIPAEEVPTWLNRVKVLVLPSASEGLPGIVKEAMACGAIVLATPVGGIPDLVRHKITGYELSNSSPEEIATQVSRILSEPCLDGISRAAREVVLVNHSLESAVAAAKNGIMCLVGTQPSRADDGYGSDL